MVKGGGSESRITGKIVDFTFHVKSKAFLRFPEKYVIVRYKERYSEQMGCAKLNTSLKHISINVVSDVLRSARLFYLAATGVMLSLL